MMTNTVMTCLALFGIAILSQGCQDPKRAALVGKKSATVMVVMNGLSPTDQTNPGLIFELSGCGKSSSSGQVVAGKTPFTVSFSVEGIKAGQYCSVEVRMPSEASSGRFHWIKSEGLAYWTADSAQVTTEANGQYVINANLSRLYQPKSPQSFTVKADVVFPSATSLANRTLVTAQMVCGTTLFQGIGAYASSTPTTGSFTFIEGVETPTPKSYTCTHFDVYADGSPPLYRGLIPPANATFSGAAGGSIRLTPTPITMQPLLTNTESGQINVSTEAGTCPPPLSYFDIKTRTCSCPTGTTLNASKTQCINID